MTHMGQVLDPDERAGVTWRISSYSENGGGSCVEVGALPDTTGRVAVRHSHHPGGTAFVISRSEWAAFVGAVRNGELAATAC